MNKTITLSITHPIFPATPIQGFRFFRACYVDGFRSESHCQKCFKGQPLRQLCTGSAESGRVYELDTMDRYEFVDVCGVGSGSRASRGRKNFHLRLKYAEGETLRTNTYNGYIVTAENAVALPIPPLPAGWKDRDLDTTSCKNFQFAVAYFGYPQTGC